MGAIAIVAVVAVLGTLAITTAPIGPLGSARPSGPLAPSGPTATGPASSFAPVTFPEAMTAPGSPYRHGVLTVAEAIERNSDPENGGHVGFVAGWFAFNPVPCPARPGATSPLENCGADFAWLMESPEQLHVLNPDGSGSINPPKGPAVNVVTGFVDAGLPSDGQPLAVVVQGHFRDERASECPAGERRDRCDALFVLDTVAWTQATADVPAEQPSDVLGLQVRTVPEALAVLEGNSPEEIAVQGWYERPPPLHCSPAAALGSTLLDDRCEGSYTVLMRDPESLIRRTSSSMEVTEPSGPALHVAFAAALPPPPNALPGAGSSTPVHVVFVGHFRDRRAELCAPERQESCHATFLVDAVAWADEHSIAFRPVDWRGSTDQWLRPPVDPVELALANLPGASVLGVTVMPGEHIGRLEPALAGEAADLSAQPSLWLVTALMPPGPCPSGTGFCALMRASVATVLVVPDGTAYRDSGAGFVRIP